MIQDAVPAHDPGGLVRMALQGDVAGDAVMSDCGRYRPLLTRRWGEGPPLCFIGMNPSTADHTVDDPTVRREIGFARREGCGSYQKANVMDYRATSPQALLRPGVEPRSDLNVGYIVQMGWLAKHQGGCVVLAWGVLPPGFRRYADEALEALREVGVPLFCLGRTKDLSPKHPLYLRSDTPLEPWGGVTA